VSGGGGERTGASSVDAVTRAVPAADARPAGPVAADPVVVERALEESGLLRGATVILTGATGGIGRDLAAALAFAGARLALADLDADATGTLAAELAAAGHAVLGAGFDAASQPDFGAFHHRVEEELGPVDGLVNCAGLWQPRPFAELTPADLARVIDANLTTAFVGCLTVLPGMVARRSGSIVNFASTAGEYGSITPAAHYAAAKGAVIGMTKSLAREASPHNVRVNAISPGPVDTVALGAATSAQKAEVGARTLFGRLGQPAEIAAGCVYLLSPLASFVTGHVLRVNGGSLL
jgi:NAD(P)-dependent dehydrogenase (short-subunit alcohol dehydrogenase family)